MSEYWWDRSGHDPELERLERTLAGLAFKPGSSPPHRAPPARRWGGRWALAAALAAAALGAAVVLLLRARGGGVDVYALAGAPSIDGSALQGARRWHPGQSLRTGPDARAKVVVGRMGEVDVDPGSLVRLVETGAKSHRLALDRGGLRAFILAPARRFFVDTREATAVDLGCTYSLRVEEDGSGWLKVAFGWVSFETGEREVLVPAGAACALHPGRGPGTPHFEDAGAGFRAALAALDGGSAGPDTLARLLAEARGRDALSLLQLLPRLTADERGPCADRLQELLPALRGVDREALVRLEPEAVNRGWRALGLGDLKWWRLGRDFPLAPPNR